MPSVTLTTENALIVASRTAELVGDVTIHPDIMQINSTNATFIDMLRRVGREPTAILLAPVAKYDRWIVAGSDIHQLERTMQHLSSFLIPSYMTFRQRNTVEPFEGQDEFSVAARSLYPAGCYKLVSRRKDREDVLQRLQSYFTLNIQQPTRHAELPTWNAYRDLYEQFRLALATEQWDQASDIIATIQQHHLTTANNVQFLRVIWLARQKRWNDLWNYDGYERLAMLETVPRAVRQAMLSALYHQKLLPLERAKDWDNALDMFVSVYGRLHKLLSTRAGLDDPAVVCVFGYLAAQQNDALLMRELRQLPGLDAVTDRILAALAGNMDEPPLDQMTDDELYQLAATRLAEGQYDTAFTAASMLRTRRDERILIMIQAAIRGDDLKRANKALETYDSMYEEDQIRLHERDPILQTFLDRLVAIVRPQTDSDIIDTWYSWFETAVSDIANPILGQSLDYLQEYAVKQVTDPDTMEKLNFLLLDVITDDTRSEEFFGNNRVKQAMRHLGTDLLEDTQFPRETSIYQEMYTIVYNSVRQGGTLDEITAQLFVRLAEAILRASPKLVDDIVQAFQVRFDYPMPALNDTALEMLELLYDFSANPGMLTAWFHGWVTAACVNLSPAEAAAWANIATWVKPGREPVTVLEKAQWQDGTTDDPIAALPDGYRIAIFTLRERSGQFARSTILERNPNLIVTLRHDKVNSNTVQSAFNGADIVVLVTHALKHALTMSVDISAQHVVLPQSASSTSILRAVEDHVSHTVSQLS